MSTLVEQPAIDRYTMRFLLASGFMGLANGSFDAVFNFFLVAKGLSKTDVGAIYAISMVGMSVAVLLQGIAARRYGLRPIHRIAAWQFALGLFAILFCDTVISAGLVLSVVSGGFVGMLSTGAAIFGSRVAPDRRVGLFSLFFASYLGCTMIGSLLAAAFTSISPWSPFESYIIVLLGSGGLALVMCWFREVSLGMPGTLEAERISEAKVNKDDVVHLTILFISSFMLGGSILLVFRFSNIIFTTDYGMSVSHAAIVLGVEKLFALAGALAAPRLKVSLPYKPLITVVTIVTVIALTVQANMPVIGVFLLAYFMRLSMNYTLMPILDAVTISAFRKEKSIVSTTVRQLAFYAGGAAAAVAYGSLLQAGQSQTAITLAAVMAGIGGIALMMVREHEPAFAIGALKEQDAK